MFLWFFCLINKCRRRFRIFGVNESFTRCKDCGKRYKAQ